MTQEERRKFLILELLKENGGQSGKYLGIMPAAGREVQLPEDEQDQKNLLRALMNVRDPLPAGEEFLKIQDEYLQQVNKERGITDVAQLSPVQKNPKLYLWQGDITTLNADGIVNAANAQLLGCFSPLHACIDNCIHSFAGIQLRLACNDLMQKQGHLEGTGLCKVTPAYNLPSRYVLHTVGPIIRTFVEPRDKVLLAGCYKSCLEAAAENKMESVAFCCISTGVFRFPADLAAQIAVSTVEEWLKENPAASVQKVIFNVFGNKDLTIYRKVLGE